MTSCWQDSSVDLYWRWKPSPSEMSSWMSRHDPRPGVDTSPPKHWIVAKKSCFWHSSASKASSPPHSQLAALSVTTYSTVKNTTWKNLHSHSLPLLMLGRVLLKEPFEILGNMLMYRHCPSYTPKGNAPRSFYSSLIIGPALTVFCYVVFFLVP